jgi:hypothetical protein
MQRKRRQSVIGAREGGEKKKETKPKEQLNCCPVSSCFLKIKPLPSPSQKLPHFFVFLFPFSGGAVH